MYYSYYYPTPRYLIIVYMDPLGSKNLQARSSGMYSKA